MATNHDIRSYECQRIFLENFRSGKWTNSIFSKDLVLQRTNKSWPSEDGNIIDSSTGLNIALEFKPKIETKRGIQTGLGQCFTYLENFSASYLICPEQVEGFKISKYMKSVFENSIRGKAPIGLIEHRTNSSNEIEIKMLCEIHDNFTLDTSKTKSRQTKTDYSFKEVKAEMLEKVELNLFASKEKESRYWAKFVDTNPNLIFLLLKSSEEVEHSGARNQLIWKYFFDNYYLPHENRNLEPYVSDIIHFNRKKMEPFRDKKKQLKKLVDENVISMNEALNELNEHCYNDGKPKLTKSKQNDNLYKSYMKNYMKAVDHLDLWDSNYILTETGRKYLNIGLKYGANSEELFLYFGKLFLEDGNHFDLIMDLEKSIKGEAFESNIQARVFSQKYMEKMGLYKRNPARAVKEGSTKIFQNEFQLWSKLNIFKDNIRYTPEKGYNFDWEKIDQYLTVNF